MFEEDIPREAGLSLDDSLGEFCFMIWHVLGSKGHSFASLLFNDRNAKVMATEPPSMQQG